MSSQPPEPPYTPQELSAVTPPRPRRTLGQRIDGLTLPQTLALGLGVGGSVLLVACLVLSVLGLVLGGSTATQGYVSAIAAVPTVTATDDATVTTEPTATSGAHPTATTHAQPTSTPLSRPTNTPTLTPTNTPCPAPCNPWGYNFTATGGTTITNPPAAFCSYFACIDNPPSYTTFWSGTGYVVECNDNKFSKTGGNHNPAPCSGDSGYMRTLYAHG